MRRHVMWLLAALLVAGCSSLKSADNGHEQREAEADSGGDGTVITESGGRRAEPDEPVDPEVDGGLAVATFAGGCFWCMEPPFEGRAGVKSVVSGYCGGAEEDPTYDEVSGGRTGHAESVQITYDPDEISYEKLLDIFWRSHYPTFGDGAPQYRPVIFYHSDEQRELAERSKKELAEEGPFDEEIETAIEPASRFWRAEDDHQNYYKKHPDQYEAYFRGSGRKEFLIETWGELPKRDE